MRCEDLMRRPVQYVHAHDSVQAAARLMRDANVGIIPVCDSARRVQGVLTDRDVATRLAAENQPADATEVRVIMSRDIVSCSASDDLAHAEALMREHHKSRILVTDSSGMLVGIISLADLAQLGEPGTTQTLAAVAERELLSSQGTRQPAGP